MNIRTLTSADAELYRELRLQALQQHPDVYLSSYESEAKLSIANTRIRLAPAEHHFTLGAFDSDDKLVGMVTLFRESRAKIDHKANVYSVYVDPAVRKQAVGRLLMLELIARAKDMPGLEQLNLTVTSTNLPAKRLYESLGFICYGTEPRAMKLGERYLDEDHMVLMLGAE
ncbi:GNAT family N-acetyltransferase [Paenibacillus sp. MMS20-IR301]|uniref:GNAT family N-acetyltransferase n=1 Tax=Paenibacillus sp. MMS20-IR301 TaxID=2895946 RepID=UPI0028EC8D7B|nr:GNAT family N-acetyltransferase [Paenibacillus sp. MMS20-IR301]WNS42354.1 GNAT family N-acetyltransferase [Paenibacillus sp. MMS20-IR301]